MTPGRFVYGMIVALALLFNGAGEAGLPRDAAVGASASPGLTVTPTAAVSPTPAQLNLTLANLNSVAPADVLAEMYIFGGAGGFSGPCDSALEPVQAARELMDPLALRVCWNGTDRSVLFKVTRPDGRVDSIILWVSGGEVRPVYQPSYDDSPGKYVMRLQGAKTSLEFQVTYNLPRKARISEIKQIPSPFLLGYSPPGPNRRLILDRFVPGEKVRLYLYKQHLNDKDHPSPPVILVGWQDLTIRADGRMPVNVSLASVTMSEVLYFMAWGQRSGEVHLFTILPIFNKRSDWLPMDLVCPGAKESRLKEWSMARVATMGGNRLIVRSAPGASSPVVTLLPRGAEVFIQSDSRCSGGVRYWEVYYENLKGWAAEHDGSRYLLEPVD